ncbi:MerR family transcriptional regulator [Acidobacteriota bacterium]
MNTAKAAEILGISKSTLLRWISSGLIEDAKRNQKGWRVWSNEDIQRLKRFAQDYKGGIEDSSHSISAQERYRRAVSNSMLFAARYDRFKKKQK